MSNVADAANQSSQDDHKAEQQLDQLNQEDCSGTGLKIETMQ
jgi:hypothetical protein